MKICENIFSLKTTWGSITVVIYDAVLCFGIYWIGMSLLAGSPEWFFFEGLYGFLTLCLLTLIVIVSMSAFHLYNSLEYIYLLDLFKKIIPAFLISFVFIAAIGFLFQYPVLLRRHLFFPLCIVYLCLFIFRYFIFFCMPKNRERILILGATDLTREIIMEARKKKFKGYEIIGIVSTLESQVGTKIHGIPVLSLIGRTEEALKKYATDNIVVTMQDRRGKLPVQDLLRCKMRNIRVQEGSTFYEKIKRKIIIDEFLKPSWFIFENGFFHTSLHVSVKRLMGAFVSLILLIILSPIFLLVAGLIKLDSPGPVFFKQKRVGKNGKVFNLIKFRSMQLEAEDMNSPVFAQKNDPRITRVGRIIRKIRIDEVPQFINIFKGDMDLVGPRPERPFFVRQLEEMAPYYNLRHAVRPGLTGWAQVNYQYGDSLDAGREKLNYDLYYVKHFSWYLDSLIILLTIKVVLFGGGR